MAVVCRNVSLSKDDITILSEVDVCVQHGQIYGLLGPSGCGKTTLLKCLIGELRPDRGDIGILQKKPGRLANRNVGYMPQQDALCELFSVRETFCYFGNLYGMAAADLHKQMRFITNLLGLDLHDSVAHLSGGQRRRLSLGVCILHAPPVLILDEPTVGVDPLLTRAIWQYLRQLADELATTIIVTTHYIEEAHGADVVALMRDGAILVEERPQVLMASYGLRSLEAVLLEVCRHPDKVKDRIAAGDDLDDQVVIGSCRQSLVENRCWTFQSVRRFAALLFKEKCSFARHPGTILYKCVFPLITLSLFFYTMECQLPDLPVAVVDEDHTIRSRVVGEILDAQEFIDVVYMNSSNAKEGLRELAVHAVLTLPKGFSTCHTSTLDVDLVNPYFRSTIQRAIRDTFLNPLLSPVSAVITTGVRLKRYGWGEVPDDGLDRSVYHRIVAQLSFGPSMLAAVTHVFVSARDAFMHRSKVAGATTAELVSSIIVSQGVLVLIQTLLLVICLAYKLGRIVVVDFEAWILVYTLLAGVGFSGVSLSLVVCSECSVFTSALHLALLLNVVTFVMCGEIWPREGMPLMLRRRVAPLWPVSYPADAIGAVLFKRHWFDDQLVLLGFASIVVWVIGPLLILTITGTLRRNSIFS